jgi:predicted DNA-binding antitoxin AbrB/MazE fold protein
MSIRAIYKNGVLKPLEELPIEEGTEVTVDVHPIEGRKESSGKRKSVKDFAAYGMWKDRTDFKDGVDYVNRVRKYRREPDPDPK